jgi:rhodanese-related sulfurtransferase
MLYESLQTKIMPLADEVIVYPGHGAGSSCGKNMGPENHSTIGEQKLGNYALQQTDKASFVTAVTEGLTAPPSYFPINAKINKEGYENINSVMEKGLKPLNALEFKELAAQDDTLILDTRFAARFTEGFVPGALSIGLEGRFAEWAGIILPFNKNILIVAEPGKEKESIVRLTRVGFEKFIGFLEGGYATWVNAGEKIDMIIDVEADELAMDIPFDPNMVIIDVRKEAEYDEAHVKDALNIPLADLTDPASMANLDDHHNIYVHCAGGYRSVIALSLLKREGFHNLRNVVGGFGLIKELGDKIEIEKTEAALN